MQTNEIKMSSSEVSDKSEENFVSIGEAFIYLMKAVSIVQSLNKDEERELLEKSEIEIPVEGLDFYKTTKRFEINLIIQALQITKGHQTKAAKLLKLNVSTLNAIIKRHNIDY